MTMHKLNAKMIIPFLADYKVLLIKVGIILIISSEVYYLDLAQVFGRAIAFTEGNITNYVLTIPFLIAFVLYRKRSVIIAAAIQSQERNIAFRLDDVLGVTLCIVAVFIYIFGSGTLYALEYHILSFPIFLAGCTMLIFDIATLRQSLFAVLLTAYIQPPPGFLVSELAADLSWSAAVLVEAMLKLTGMAISLDSGQGAPALVVVLPSGGQIPFFVGEPSSGVFSTIGLSLFAVFVAYITRGKVWKRSIIFAMGFPLFFILNTFRIALILVFWYLWGQEVAETFHIVSGSLMVAIGTILLLVIGERVLGLTIRTVKNIQKQCVACERSLANREFLCLYCGRMLKSNDHRIKHIWTRIATLAGLSIIIISASLVSQPSYSEKQTKLSNLDISAIKGPETTDYFLPQIGGWDLNYAYRDARIESVLNQDAVLAYRYTLQNQSAADSEDFVLTPYVYASVQISNGHHVWEDSLVTYPSRVGRPSATLLESSDYALSGDITGRFLMFQRVGSKSTEAVFYWFERVPLKFGSDYLNRNVLLSIWTNTNALSKTGLIKAPDDSEGIKQLYLPMAKAIEQYWSSQTSQVLTNEIALKFIQTHVVALVAISLSPVGILIMRGQIRAAKLRRANKKLYETLEFEDKSLLAYLVSGRTGDENLTGKLVADAYRKATSKAISEVEVMEQLNYARKSGLLKGQLSSIQDQPVLVWKPTFVIKSSSMGQFFHSCKKYLIVIFRKIDRRTVV
jgi:exosortase/archaeosortase family protein